MYSNKIVFILLIYVLGLPHLTSAQGDLLINPTRVVFEGNKQRETLSLVNLGKDTATFSISFVRYKMNEDGSFTIIEKLDTGQMFADPYLRIFPRTVTLAPGEPQTVMLQYRRKAEMLAGEYRSHLYFRAEKNNEPLGMGNPAKDSTNLNVQLTAIYGISIPVIIRTGELSVSSTLSDIKLETSEDTIQILKFVINRTGNISVYGDIIIEYIPERGRTFEVGVVKGVGVYTNINKRNIAVKLNNTPGKVIRNGKLKVRYVRNDDGKPIVYDEKEIDI
jgi:hypothetical protein